jgi:hypothetical protein
MVAYSVWRLVTGWTTERSEFESRQDQDFNFSISSKPVLGSTQSIQWVTGAFSSGLKRPGREVHSSPTSGEVK